MDLSAISRFVLDPDSFFRSISPESPGILVPTLIVLSIGGSNLAAGLLTGAAGSHIFLKAFLFSESPVLVLAVPVVLWILLSGVLYFIGIQMTRTGSFLITLRNTGFCLAPVAIFSIVYHTAWLTIGVATASHFQEGLQFVLVLFVYAIASFFWTGYLLTFGVQQAHGLSSPQAFNAVLTGLVLLVVILIGLEFVNLGIHTAGPTGPLTD